MPMESTSVPISINKRGNIALPAKENRPCRKLHHDDDKRSNCSWSSQHDGYDPWMCVRTCDEYGPRERLQHLHLIAVRSSRHYVDADYYSVHRPQQDLLDPLLVGVLIPPKL